MEAFNECRLLEKLGWAWTFQQLREADAGDIEFLKEFFVMTAPMVEETADAGAGDKNTRH